MEIIKPVTWTNLFEWLGSTNKRINLLVGGAGSSKNWSIAQHIISKAFNENNKRILITRKTLPSLRITAYKLILDLLKEYDLPYSINKTEMIITTSTGTEILFKNLDEPEKIKSAEFNYIWVEEATEITLDDYRQLNLRLRRQNSLPNQIFLSCNPISRLNWVYTEIVEKPDNNIAIHRSTYQDNPFCDKEYIDYIKGLINQDMNYYRIYVLGEWGILKDIIYNNYDTVEALPSNADDVFYGLDFGFNNQTALVKIMVKDKEPYLQEIIYRTKMTNNDVINNLRDFNINDGIIYADSAEPARIEEICQNGFICKPAEKDVNDGIDFVKRQKLHITKDSVNLLKEISGYKYREDKNKVTLEEPLKFNDHLMDALRYGLYTHLGKPVDMFFKIG
jgi:phage terminase large subunit